MVRVRAADQDDHYAVLNVLHAGMLDVDDERIEAAIDSEDVLVVTNDEGTVIGTLVLEGERVGPIAVRPGRRDQGIGTALVESALERRDRLVAEFDPEVRPFYESAGFEIESIGDGDRLRGTLEG